MNWLRLSEENSTDVLFSFAKGLGGHCCDQVFCRKNSFFQTYYGMATDPLIWVDTPYFLDEHAHGDRFSYDIEFETTPYLIHFIWYTLWLPVHYYDVEDNYPNTKEHLADSLDSISTTLPWRISLLSQFQNWGGGQIFRV